MKVLKLKKLLLPVSIIIWSFIIYKVYVVVFDKTNEVVMKSDTHAEQKQVVKEDTFRLMVNYPDPFLNNFVTREINRNSISTSHSKIGSRNKKEIVWPRIDFLGVFQNKNSGKSLANLNIDGKCAILAKGNEMEGIKLISVYPDSVQLGFDHQIRTFKLKN